MLNKVFNSFQVNSAEESSCSMGKCVSKQPSVANLNVTDFVGSKAIKRKFSELSDFSEIYENSENFESRVEESRLQNEGQSESKKNSKRGGLETKGTAMSFGFRKKFQSSNKKNANLLKEKEKEKDILANEEKINDETTVISNQEVIEAVNDASAASDKNGNEESTNKKQEMRRVTLHGVPVKHEMGGIVPAYKGSRFGFRSSNIVRPASVGLTPKIAEFDENIENNNLTDKRRSKSASGTRRLQPVNRYQINDPHAIDVKSSVPKIGSVTTTSTVNNNRNHWFLQQTRQNVADTQTNHPHSTQSDFGKQPGQYTIVNAGMHTNVIVKPTPQATPASISKFTLHTTSLPKPQYPVPISLSSSRVGMDSKNAKQVVNNSRKGFQGPREISNDSGIGSLDNNCEYPGGGTSPSRHRQRNRPRNLEMIFSSRHKFEVRDLEDTLSCDSIEPLSLPKLPSVFSSDNQTVPLSGLVRPATTSHQEFVQQDSNASRKTNQTHSDAESIDEEKLFRDRSTSEKTAKNPSIKDYSTSSKNSSPGSSRASWCNAGESLALKDYSSFSLSSSDESKDNQNDNTATGGPEEEVSSMTITTQTTSSPKNYENNNRTNDRPNILSNIAETKFAEMAAAVSDILLDDETSPTDSLVSSTESDEMILKKAKKKCNENIQEKDIDEIFPEIDMSSPLSPGTPTHASNSFSLSDVGRDFLIDDEIADQPALLFSDKADLADAAHMLHSLTDTPTLIETNSTRSSTHKSKPKLPSLVILENNNRTPISKRRLTLLTRAESLDTLSPCESIASDDLMMDFETSSMDSIDRLSHSIRSRCGSALQAMDDAQLLSELQAKSGEVMREWNNILRVHRTSKDNSISQLPARATRLLNRSRLQQSQLSNTGSDSPKSIDSLPRKNSRASSLHLSGRDPVSSSDDLIFTDKSFRNSMIQDVLYFKKQLIRLRRILQDTETLNPFEQSNGQFFASCGLDSQYQTDEKDLSSLTSSTSDDPKQELADLRRQVVYLQGQLHDRDRTIRLQKNMIDKLEAAKDNSTTSVATSISEKERINSATQTDRVRPLSIGQEGLARSRPECSSYTTYFPATTSTTTSIPTALSSQASRRHTVISTTFSNLNHITSACPTRRSSLSLEKLAYKPVKTTLIGEPLKNQRAQQIQTRDSNLTETLTNGFNGITLNGGQNDSSPLRLINGETNYCHATNSIHFDDRKHDHQNSQTITIV